MELEYWQPLLVGWGVGMAMGFTLAVISVCCYKQARAEVEQNEREQEEIQQPERSSSEAEVLIEQSSSEAERSHNEVERSHNEVERSSSKAERPPAYSQQSTECSTFPRPKKFKYSLVKLFN